MSEVMEQGVLRMPPHLWTGDPLDVMQRHAHYVAAADELERLRADLAAARADAAQWKFALDCERVEQEQLREQLAAARALLTEARAYVVADHGWSYVYPTGWLADRIDAALAGQRREG